MCIHCARRGILTTLPTLLPRHPPNSKLQLALALAEHLLAVADGSHTSLQSTIQNAGMAEGGAVSPGSTQLPFQVLATYYRTVLEWTVASLLKLKPPKLPAGNGNTKEQPSAAQQGQLPAEQVAYASHLVGLWGLLRMLLERGGPVLAVLREGGVPGSLLPAAAQSLRCVVPSLRKGARNRDGRRLLYSSGVPGGQALYGKGPAPTAGPH